MYAASSKEKGEGEDSQCQAQLSLPNLLSMTDPKRTVTVVVEICLASDCFLDMSEILFEDRKRKTVPRSKSLTPDKRGRMEDSLSLDHICLLLLSLLQDHQANLSHSSCLFILWAVVSSEIHSRSEDRSTVKEDEERVKRSEPSKFMPPNSWFPQPFRQFVPPFWIVSCNLLKQFVLPLLPVCPFLRRQMNCIESHVRGFCVFIFFPCHILWWLQ